MAKKRVPSDVVQESATKGADSLSSGNKVYIDSSKTIDEVLQLDSQGAVLHFVHEGELFLELPDDVYRQLSYENKLRYSVSKECARNHRPESDEFARRVQFVASAASRKKHAEQLLKQMPTSARASRKLAAYVGEGFREHWFRPDEMVDAAGRGWEVVTPDMVDRGEAWTTVQAENGHFEIKADSGRTDLVLYRIPESKAREIEQEKTNKILDRERALQNSGRRAIKSLGSDPIESERRDLDWHDGQ